MLNSITVLVKNGRLKEAAEQLHQYASKAGMDSELLTDIVVLNGSINDAIKQEKRRKISTEKALELKTRYAFELEDLLGLVRDQAPQTSNNTASQDIPSTPVTDENTNQGNQGQNKDINNNISITVNVSIENKITTEIRNNINGLSESIGELKSELSELPDDEAKATLKDIEKLGQNLEAIRNAEEKQDLPPALQKVENFLKRIQDGNDHVAKAFKMTKKGVDILQKIGNNYNSIAQWAGLPQIPKLFL